MYRIFTQSKKQISYAESGTLPEIPADSGDICKWIDAVNMSKEDLEKLLATLSLDQLTVEDITEGKQRVKVEDYNDYVFVVSKAVTTAQNTGFGYSEEEQYIILKENLLVTIHKQESPAINMVAKAITNRKQDGSKAPQLASLALYMILDSSVDSFYSVISGIDSWLAATGGNILDVDRLRASDLKQMKNLMGLINKAKREMNELRITLTQFRDLVSQMQKGTIKFIVQSMTAQYRDIYDHTFQLIETLDLYTVRTSDLRDLYFTIRAAFTDNILKFLTIVATIFLPLTFLTGFYGMNFTLGFYQPGTGSIYGFYAMVTVMLVIAGSLTLYFYRKGWL